jgi:hypothetical protein
VTNVYEDLLNNLKIGLQIIQILLPGRQGRGMKIKLSGQVRMDA